MDGDTMISDPATALGSIGITADDLPVPDFGGRFFNVKPDSWAEHARNLYSQNGEDGIVAEIFRRIGTTNKFCFEAGAADGRWMSNTRKLIDEGWSAVLVESDPDRLAELRKLESNKVTVAHRHITDDGPDSIDNVLKENGCPEDPDLGVIDVDGPDYYILNSMLTRPRVLLVEFDPASPKEFIPERGAEGQAGWQALFVLGKSKGYHAVAYTRFNFIFVRFEDSAAAVAATNLPLKLNLGGGTGPEIPGYEVVDRKSGSEVYPLAYPDGCADEIRASHVLEHLPFNTTLAAVEDWVRVLKPGGKLKVAVPDLNFIIDHLKAGNRDLPLEGYLMGGQTDENDFHHAVFTENKLRNIMYGLGLRKIRRWESEIRDCASLPVSLNLEGTKPANITVKGVEAMMSVPRYGATAAFECIGQALRSAGNIPLRVAYGAYWDEALTNAILQTLHEGNAEWILFIDFDSVFNADDVKELYRLATTTPGVDAVCPVQMGRTLNKALIVMKPDENGKYSDKVSAELFDQELMEIQSGHFGCTLVRADAIRKMSKPWFLAKPSDEGAWAGKGYVSADISFWRKFTSEGFKLFSANQVVLGHIQEMLLWPGRNLQLVTQEISDYRKVGPPPETWR